MYYVVCPSGLVRIIGMWQSSIRYMYHTLVQHELFESLLFMLTFIVGESESLTLLTSKM